MVDVKKEYRQKKIVASSKVPQDKESVIEEETSNDLFELAEFHNKSSPKKRKISSSKTKSFLTPAESISNNTNLQRESSSSLRKRNTFLKQPSRKSLRKGKT